MQIRRYVKEWVAKYPSIRLLSENITSRRRMGSEGTVQSYIIGIRRFIRFLGLRDPEEAIAKFKSGELNASRLIDRFIDWSLERNYTHKTVRLALFGLKKWLELNDVMVDWKHIEFPTSTEIHELDKAPTKEELRRILDHAGSTRNKAAILVLATSGLRAGTLLSLKIGDVDFSYPDVARISVWKKKGRKFTSKRGIMSGRFYCTFITPEAKELLLAYLRERERAGEKLTDESPLIGDSNHKGKPVTVEALEKVWYRILRRAGFNEKSRKWYLFHIHTLRKFFRSNCVGVDPSYREFWMGHKGGYLDESYFRAEEPKHLAEYRKAIPHLTIYTSPMEEREIRKKAILDFARLQGYSEEEIRKLEEVLAKSESIEEAVKKFRLSRKQRETMPNGAFNNQPRYIIAKGEKQLLGYLERGWTLIKELNGEKYLLQKA